MSPEVIELAKDIFLRSFFQVRQSPELNTLSVEQSYQKAIKIITEINSLSEAISSEN